MRPGLEYILLTMESVSFFTAESASLLTVVYNSPMYWSYLQSQWSQHSIMKLLSLSLPSQSNQKAIGRQTGLSSLLIYFVFQKGTLEPSPPSFINLRQGSLLSKNQKTESVLASYIPLMQRINFQLVFSSTLQRVMSLQEEGTPYWIRSRVRVCLLAPTMRLSSVWTYPRESYIVLSLWTMLRWKISKRTNCLVSKQKGSLTVSLKSGFCQLISNSVWPIGEKEPSQQFLRDTLTIGLICLTRSSFRFLHEINTSTCSCSIGLHYEVYIPKLLIRPQFGIKLTQSHLHIQERNEYIVLKSWPRIPFRPQHFTIALMALWQGPVLGSLLGWLLISYWNTPASWDSLLCCFSAQGQYFRVHQQCQSEPFNSYIASISLAKRLLISLRLSFMVGVIVPLSIVKSSRSSANLARCWALEMALALALAMPSSRTCLSFWLIAASVVSLRASPNCSSWETHSGSSLPWGSHLRVSRQVRNLRLSPITTTCERKGSASFTAFSIRMGATFSPPAVIISSFIRPVIKRLPRESSLPTSPECRQPSRSIVAIVSFSSLKQPRKRLRPRQQISPLPSLSGLRMMRSVPSMGKPASFMNVSSKLWCLSAWVKVSGPAHSDMPYTFISRKFSDMKYDRTEDESGAAPQRKYFTWSSPSAAFTLSNTTFFARLQPKGGSFPVASAQVPAAPIPFAHSAILRFTKPFFEAMSFICSSIFYQTRGTDKKKVGRTSLRQVTREPCRAVGSAKQTWALQMVLPTTSSACPATCDRGRQERMTQPRSCSKSYSSLRYLILKMQLSWLSKTPFGGPVVPLVQTRVQVLPGLIESMRLSTRPAEGPSCPPKSRNYCHRNTLAPQMMGFLVSLQSTTALIWGIFLSTSWYLARQVAFSRTRH